MPLLLCYRPRWTAQIHRSRLRDDGHRHQDCLGTAHRKAHNHFHAQRLEIEAAAYFKAISMPDTLVDIGVIIGECIGPLWRWGVDGDG